MNVLFKKIYQHCDVYGVEYLERRFAQLIVDLIEIICQQYFKHFRYGAIIYFFEHVHELKLGNSILVLNTSNK